MRSKKIFLAICMFFFLFASLSFASAQLTQDNLGYYALDGTSGEVADSSGSGNDGVNNGATRGVTGKIANAFDFDGSDVVDSTGITKSQISNAGAVSISFWLNLDNTNERRILGWNSGSTNYVLAQYYDNSIRFYNGDQLDYSFTQTGSWHHFVLIDDGTNRYIYHNGSQVASDSQSGIDSDSENFKIGDIDGSGSFDGQIDEVSVWNKSLSNQEIQDLYNNGNGKNPYGNFTEANVELISPANDTITSDRDINFTTNFTASGFNWTNFTTEVYHENGSVVHSASGNLSGNVTQSNAEITGIEIGEYMWNTKGCYENATFSNCTYAENNFSFAVGAETQTQNWSNTTLETENENFTGTFEVANDSEISLAELVYDGTSYNAQIENNGNTFEISRNLDIPLKDNETSENQTNEWYWNFTFEGDFTQTTENKTQVVRRIQLQDCSSNPGATNHTLNFTFKDERSQDLLNMTNRTIDYEASYDFWKGSGTVQKNASFTKLDYDQTSVHFCIEPEGETLKTTSQSIYSADGYPERNYDLFEAEISNETSEITLFMLNNTQALKFTQTVRQGSDFITGSYVTISKYFVGEGAFKTISRRQTDSAAQFVEFLDLDRNYRYSVTSGDTGELQGTTERKATCEQQPCSQELQIDGDPTNVWRSFGDYYASNVLSNLSYNENTETVEYDFIDTTGLAQYFRLEVSNTNYEGDDSIICDKRSFVSSGSLECDVSNKTGDFTAETFVSRSPEQVDKVITFVISEIQEQLGTTGIFISIAIILTMCFAGASISGGNPSVVLFFFGASILLLKVATIFPYSWGVIALIELGVIVLISLTRT